ncbi:uncharacterized mitochondrial protein AtMg00810-like [Tripterygium wilfordii]|uniref:uncharacterized mitochondrial protein AtMg00810-like n=1 Tax=Tripterygium wilfordii TaxID=458696 RepID=UPI0018F85826|nr:uncharacterized mitochondrial protein AtMg00810-like [Tripterygium wilfordii]
MATSKKGLFLNQRKYVLDLLREANMLTCKPAITPMDSKLQLPENGELVDSIQVYQRLVGKLIYLTITRPDISHTVSIVSQFMHAPTVDHMAIVKQILRYLKGSIGRGVLMKHNGHFQIHGYTDADWARNNLDRKSTTRYCIFVGDNLVSWKSKKQMVVARSSAEAEYRAMVSIAAELMLLCISPPILFSMSAPNISKSIAIIFDNIFSHNLRGSIGDIGESAVIKL